MKTEIFEKIGLNANESYIYNILLTNGEMRAPNIAEKAHLKLTRQNTYAVLKSLTKKGLVEEFDKRKKLTYRVEHPQKLLEVIEEQKKELEENEKTVEALMPEIISDYNLAHNKPGVVYYEGIEGIKKIYEDTLREKPEEILVFRSPFEEDKLGQYIHGYTKRRAALGIKTKIISPKKPAKEILVEDRERLRERKYIKKEIFSLYTEINVYKNKVAFIAFGKKTMGFIVESPEVAQTMRTVFNLVWSK